MVPEKTKIPPDFLRGILLVFTILSALCFSCSREKQIKYPVIDLPPTPPINLETNWGVVLSSPLRLREAPSRESRALVSLWQGYVVEIFGQTAHMEKIEDRTSYWYQINYDGLQGWVFGGYLEIFDSRDDAERAARSR